RPETLGQALGDIGPVGDELPGVIRLGDVDDQRIVGGPALGAKDTGDGRGVESIGAEAIDGFGGKGDEAAAAQHTSGPRYYAGVRGDGIDGEGFGVHEMTSV